MIYTHKTIAELMAHFRIRKELYGCFCGWVNQNAERLGLMVPGTENQRHRRYDWKKIEAAYDRKWHFGTADHAAPVAPAPESDLDTLRAEVKKARRERRKATVRLLREARRHAAHAMIADTHAELSEARCAKYLSLLGLEFQQQRFTRWAFLVLTGASLLISTAFIISNLF